MAQGQSIHRKRYRRYDEPWDAHFLTFSCFRRQPFFTGRLAPTWFLEVLDAARRMETFDLWAWVIMREHVHLVIWPGETYSISRILWRIKRPLSWRVIKYVSENRPEFLRRMEHRTGGGKVTRRFWAPGGGYDRNLYTAYRIHQKIKYVHENPVLRGLVDRPEDWAWSSYRAWMGDTNTPLALDTDSVPTLQS